MYAGLIAVLRCSIVSVRPAIPKPFRPWIPLLKNVYCPGARAIETNRAPKL